jgi:hypothetical protein
MNERDVGEWFEDYLSAFEAAGRGDRPPAHLKAFYSVPLLLATDDVVVRLRTTAEVASWLQEQVDGLLAERYDHTERLAGETTILNRSSAVHRGSFSRRRADGREISAFSVTYLITDEADGLRIAALALHSP